MFGVKAEGSRGVTCQSRGDDVLVHMSLRYQALRAEVAAILGLVVERDAPAPWVILA